MKKIVSLLLVIVLLVCAFALSACEVDDVDDTPREMSNEEKLYRIVVSSQFFLNEVADRIYENWYECIFEHKYGGDIDEAVNSALSFDEAIIKILKENDEDIKELYKEVKDGELSEEFQTVMQAYTDYYNLVVNVSGSFLQFRENKEICKQELSSAMELLSRKFD